MRYAKRRIHENEIRDWETLFYRIEGRYKWRLILRKKSQKIISGGAVS